MSVYPGDLDEFPTRAAHVDTYDAQDMNDVQTAIAAVEAELGTDPAGSAADLKTRLAVVLNNDGTLKNTTRECFYPPLDGTNALTNFYHFPSIPLNDAANNEVYLGGLVPSNFVSLQHAYLLFGSTASGNVSFTTEIFFNQIGQSLMEHFANPLNDAFPISADLLMAWDIAPSLGNLGPSDYIHMLLTRYGAQPEDTLSAALYVYGLHLSFTASR